MCTHTDLVGLDTDQWKNIQNTGKTLLMKVEEQLHAVLKEKDIGK